jgi:hypothetical protein
MTAAEVDQAITDHFTRWKAGREKRAMPTTTFWDAIQWQDSHPHLNRWDKLPA